MTARPSSRGISTWLGLVLAALGLCAAAAVPDVSSKRSHTLALDAAGNVYAWGSDADGQLGTGRAIYATTPTVLAGIPAMASVDAGWNHVIALDDAGNVWTWGASLNSQLGQRANADDARPGLVLGITQAIAVAAGQAFSAALRADGSVWFWGGGNPVPRPVAGLQGIVRIDAGDSHLVALKSDGTVWTFGSNSNGQLGDGTTTDRETAVQVPGLAGITAVAAGYRQTLALKQDGTVLAWGANYPQSASTVSPVAVAGLTGVVAIAADQYSFAVKSDGTVVEWGNDFVPVAVAGMTGVQALAVGGGASGYSLFGITAGGGLIADGSNAVGQRGLGNTNFQFAPTAVPGVSGITHVAAGFYFAAARRSDGKILVWGSNSLGQLGNGDVISHSIPRRVQGLPSNIVAVKAGSEFSLALDGNGEVWGWGRSDTGQLGSPGTPRSVPAKIPGLAGVVEMSAGCNHAMFRLGNGTVEIRGGVGNTNNGLVAGLSNIVRIGGGCGVAFAVRDDNAVFGWGWNFNGQVGDGTTTERGTPVQLTAFDSPVVSIDLLQNHAIAVTLDGAVWTWGANDFGQLGDGTRTQRPTPARVAGITAAVAAAAGHMQSLALLADGTVRGWGGLNTDGSVGDGSGLQRLTPVALPGLDGVSRLGAAISTSYAVRAGGTTWAWGSVPNSAQPLATLGDGTYVTRLGPVLVLRDAESNGNLDLGNWYLDLDAGAADNVPASAGQRIIAVAQLSGSGEGKSLSASINYRLADYGKVAGTYILGHVPPAFLQQVQASPQLSRGAIAKLVKDGTPILVQLTPAGWTTIGGQLVAFNSATINGNGAAHNILNSVNLSQIPGARFCIGYGESAADMLSSQTLREVLTLDGAAGTANGLPCVLSGVYVSGPASSNNGTPVTFVATVVGATPGGTVQLKDLAFSPAPDVGGPLALTLQNEAVAQASYTTSALAAGAHSIGARYSGDLQNPASDSPVPLRHQVAAATTGSAVRLEGPASSSRSQPVTFTAAVTGNQPAGTVQFNAGGTPLGAPVALLEGVATLTIATLAVGGHSITATYSGDAQNVASSSPALAHTVHASLGTSVELATNANPAPQGTSITFTATVTGANPTGQVVFRSSGALLGTAALAGGSAGVSLSSLEPGVHAVVAEYGGDGGNPAATSSTLYQQVSAATAPATFALTVAKQGSGAGSVTSTPAGIDCGAACSASFAAGSQVTLTAAPAAGSAFVGWSGACSGSGACSVSMSAARTVQATFTARVATSVALASSSNPSVVGQPITFTASVSGGNPSGSVAFRAGTTTLCNATVASATAFCQVASLAAGTHAIVAEYTGDSLHNGSVSPALSQVVQPARYALTVSRSGTGTGSVASTPAGIACGATCSADFDGGTVVALAATPAAGSIFAGWSGEGCTGNAGCQVTMSQARSITALFTLPAAAPAGSASPGSVDFGGQSMRTTSVAATVTLTNVGTGTLVVNGVTASPAAFAQANGCGSLGTGASCAVTLRFTPVAEGPVAGALVFDTNAGTVTVPLGGVGERSLVTHYYRAILNRAPDESGKAFWAGEFSRLGALGANPIESWFLMANYFFNSSEYLAANKTRTAFLGDVYNTFFNRPPDQAGFDFWTSQMSAGLSREGVIFWFMFSNEFRAFAQAIFGDTAARPEVDMVMDLFRGILNRFPETTAFNAYVGGLRAAQCQPAAQRAGAVYTQVNDMSYFFLFGSAEYAGRNRSNQQFVSDMYNTFLRRGGTDEEVDFWINRLDTGASDRNTMRAAFIASPEFGARVQAVIAAGCPG